MSRCGYLRDYSHIYMRWKEQCFLNTGEDCGLTIAGFYYICMSRKTGEVHGKSRERSSTSALLCVLQCQILQMSFDLDSRLSWLHITVMCGSQGSMWTHSQLPTITSHCGHAHREWLGLRHSLLFNIDRGR